MLLPSRLEPLLAISDAHEVVVQTSDRRRCACTLRAGRENRAHRPRGRAQPRSSSDLRPTDYRPARRASTRHAERRSATGRAPASLMIPHSDLGPTTRNARFGGVAPRRAHVRTMSEITARQCLNDARSWSCRPKRGFCADCPVSGSCRRADGDASATRSRPGARTGLRPTAPRPVRRALRRGPPATSSPPARRRARGMCDLRDDLRRGLLDGRCMLPFAGPRRPIGCHPAPRTLGGAPAGRCRAGHDS